MGTLMEYKTHRTTKLGDGNTIVIMNVYEGDITTEKEVTGSKNTLADVTRFRRDGGPKTYEMVFHDTKTEQEITDTKKEKLNEDKTRTPVDEQKIVAEAKP